MNKNYNRYNPSCVFASPYGSTGHTLMHYICPYLSLSLHIYIHKSSFLYSNLRIYYDAILLRMHRIGIQLVVFRQPCDGDEHCRIGLCDEERDHVSWRAGVEQGKLTTTKAMLPSFQLLWRTKTWRTIDRLLVPLFL